jgi:hypothetical protein
MECGNIGRDTPPYSYMLYTSFSAPSAADLPQLHHIQPYNGHICPWVTPACRFSQEFTTKSTSCPKPRITYIMRINMKKRLNHADLIGYSMKNQGKRKGGGDYIATKKQPG